MPNFTPSTLYILERLRNHIPNVVIQRISLWQKGPSEIRLVGVGVGMGPKICPNTAGHDAPPTKLVLLEPEHSPMGEITCGRSHVLLASFHTGLSSYWKDDGSLEMTE